MQVGDKNYEILIRRRGETGYAAFCPELELIVNGTAHEQVENKMKELAARNLIYTRKDISKAEAIEFFSKKGDEYKTELISELTDGTITLYTQGNFTDL